MLSNNQRQEIVDSVTSHLESLFNFIHWPSKAFREIVKKQIDKQPSSSIATENLIKKCEDEVIKKIPYKINSETDVFLINKFIEFINIYTRYNKYTKLQAIAEFFNSIKNFKESVTYSTILETNQTLYQIINANIDLNNVAKKRMQAIMSEESINWLIADYCSIHNLDILDTIEEKKITSAIDVVEHDSVTAWLKSAIFLSKEDKKRLIKEYKQGSKKAQELLVRGHLKFIYSIARRYIGKGVPLLDLMQEGTIGFMIALEKYNIEKNLQITTYAHSWIRQVVGRLVHNQGKTIRLPVHIQAQRKKVFDTARILESKLNREPTYQEIADELSLTKDQVEHIYRLPDTLKSIDEQIGDDNDTTLGELIKDEWAIDPEDASEKTDMREKIYYYLSLLKSRRTEQILRMRFGLYNGEEMTLEQVGKEFNVTRERIRQIEAKGLKELKRIIEREAKSALYRQLPQTTTKTTHISKTNQPPKNIERKPKEKSNMEEVKKVHSTVSILGKTAEDSQNQEQTKKQGRKKGKQIKTIYEIFSDYPKEQVDIAISQLADEDKKILEERYGEDLENPTTSPTWTPEKSQIFYGNIRFKIERRLKKEQPKTKKNRKSQSIKNTELTTPENNQTSFDEIFRHPIFQEKARQLTLEQTIVISLKLGYVNGKTVETSTIAQLLGMSEEEVNEVTKTVLNGFKEDLLTILNNQQSSNDKGAYTKTPPFQRFGGLV